MAGLGKLLANPLVISVLAANGASQAANAYNAATNAPDPNDERFVLQSLASGGPVGEIAPKRGLFGKGLQALGVLPNKVSATPEQLAKETLALRSQGMQGLDTQYKLSELAKNVGHENFNALMEGQFGKLMSGLGAPTAEFQSPFPNELKKQENVPTKTEYSTIPGVADKIEPTADILARGGTPAPGTAFKPPAKPPETPEHREAMVRATTKGKVGGMLDLTPSAYGLVSKADLYDPDTFDKVSDRQAARMGIKTAGEGINQGLISVPRSEQHSVNEMGAANASIDALISGATAAAKTKTPLFVDTKGMNETQARQAIAQNAIRIRGSHFPTWIPVVGGMNLYGAKGIDPKLAGLYQQTMTVEIPSLYGIQHRYVSGAELKAVPDAFPNFLTDNLATAITKYKNLKDSMSRSIWGGLKDAGSSEVYRSAVDAVDKAFAPEDVTVPEAVPTESDSEGPTIPPPTAADEE